MTAESNAVPGNDILKGGDDGDFIWGDGNRVTDNVRCGNDVLVGGAGDDLLAGDLSPFRNDIDLTNVTRGGDRFVFANGCGLDTILDFDNDNDKSIHRHR